MPSKRKQADAPSASGTTPVQPAAKRSRKTPAKTPAIPVRTRNHRTAQVSHAPLCREYVVRPNGAVPARPQCREYVVRPNGAVPAQQLTFDYGRLCYILRRLHMSALHPPSTTHVCATSSVDFLCLRYILRRLLTSALHPPSTTYVCATSSVDYLRLRYILR